MRKRKNDIHLFLSDDEVSLLNEFSIKTKKSKSEVLRFLLNTAILVEAPAIDYRKWIRELRMIGNNINQVLVIAKSNGVFNSLELQKHLCELDSIEDGMKEEINYLRKNRRRWE